MPFNNNIFKISKQIYRCIVIKFNLISYMDKKRDKNENKEKNRKRGEKELTVTPLTQNGQNTSNFFFKNSNFKKGKFYFKYEPKLYYKNRAGGRCWIARLCFMLRAPC